jgi:single-strand DNA-binding protein
MMSRSVNRVTLIGNLTKDVEVRYTGSGTAVASFSIATNESYEKDGEKKESVQYHNCVAWKKLAEICGEYLKKGSKVYVEGRIQYRTYDDKQGIKKYVTEIVLDELVMLDSRKDAPEATVEVPTGASVPVSKDEDLPFNHAG